METSSAELGEGVVYISSPQLLNECGGVARGAGAGAGSLELGRRLLGAARRGDSAGVLQLMASGAPFTADWLGTTALHAAAAGAHRDTCAVLLRAGVSRDARTKVERTPLHVAAHAGHAAVARLLLERGAAVDARDMLRMTPLHWAAERGHAAVVGALLAAGADPAARSKFHKTPLQLAAARAHLHVVRQLEDAARARPRPADPAGIPAAEQQRALDSIQSEASLLVSVNRPLPTSSATGSSSPGSRPPEEHGAERPAAPAGPAGAPEKDPPAEGGAGAGAALLRRHGITLLPPDSSSTVLNAIQSGRTVVLSDAGKLMLKDTPAAPAGAGAGAAAGAGSKGVILTAAAVRAPPAPGVKIFTVNNKRSSADTAQDVQIKVSPAGGSPRRVVRARRAAGGAGGAPLKIILQKPSACKLLAANEHPAEPAPAPGPAPEAGRPGAEYVCVPAEFLSSTSAAYLRAQLLAAHTTIHELRQQVARLRDQLALHRPA